MHGQPIIKNTVYVYSICKRTGEAPCQVITCLASGTSVGLPWTNRKENRVTYEYRNRRFEVPNVGNFSIQVFGVVGPCRWVFGYRRVGAKESFHIQGATDPERQWAAPKASNVRQANCCTV